jgi:hypothetical protein
MTTPTTSTCPPRYSTPRSPERPTFGPAVTRVAEFYFGRTLMPWQQHVLDVALEIDPETGLLAYDEIGLTVPRQSGKTSIVMPMAAHRFLNRDFFLPRQQVLYTAQTRIAARQKWEKEFVADCEDSKRLQGKFVVRRAIGDETIRFPGTRGQLGIEAVKETSGHGGTLDIGYVDEAFAQVDDRLEQAFKPAMVTRPNSQFWVVSTAGSSKSTYLRGKVERGRALASRLRHGVAYFEWSADDDTDPADVATWRSCMPALGITQTEAKIRSFFESMELGEFSRAFLNRWNDHTTEQKIPAASWRGCLDRNAPIVGQPVFCVEVSWDRSHAAIVAAGFTASGLPAVEVVKYEAGTEWVLPWLQQRRGQYRCLVVDRSGPAGSLLPDLTAPGLFLDLKIAGTRDLAQACGALYDAAVTEQLRHLGQAQLDLALSGALVRQLGDVWVWDRKASAVDVSPITGATLALWGLSSYSAGPFFAARR